MRKILVLLASLIISAQTFSQTVSLTENFTTGVDILNDIVMDSPDGIDFRTINPGFNVYGMYSYRIPASKISLAIGLGLGMHNLHSNGLLTDTSGVSYFQSLDQYNGKEVDYKINKLQLTYLDIPVEIRFKSVGGFRIAAGMKAGLLLSAHTKYKGDNPAGGRDIKIKEGKLPNLGKWRFGPTFQVGYKWINLTAFYSLSTIFDELNGPGIYPVSVGLSLRPF